MAVAFNLREWCGFTGWSSLTTHYPAYSRLAIQDPLILDLFDVTWFASKTSRYCFVLSATTMRGFRYYNNGIFSTLHRSNGSQVYDKDDGLFDLMKEFECDYELLTINRKVRRGS